MADFLVLKVRRMGTPPRRTALAAKKAKKKILILCFALLLHTSDTTGTIDSETAIKVSNSFHPSMETCFLEQVTSAVGTKYGCIMLCRNTPTCLLACSKGKECRLYNSNVSPGWPGMPSGDDTAPLTDFDCYSLWADARDMAPGASKISSPLQVGVFKRYAADGYGCHSGGPFFKADLHDKPWIRFDLGSPQQVGKVAVQTRGTGASGDLTNHFKNIEVRVGNTARNGDFGINALLETIAFTPRGSIDSFEANGPREGRYVSVQRKETSGRLIISELKILPP